MIGFSLPQPVACQALQGVENRGMAANRALRPRSIQENIVEGVQQPQENLLAMDPEQDLPNVIDADLDIASEDLEMSSTHIDSPTPSSSLASPPIPPRRLQQTIEHLARRAPDPLEPKVMPSVSRKEGSAWAETTRTGKSTFSLFESEEKGMKVRERAIPTFQKAMEVDAAGQSLPTDLLSETQFLKGKRQDGRGSLPTLGKALDSLVTGEDLKGKDTGVESDWEGLLKMQAGDNGHFFRNVDKAATKGSMKAGESVEEEKDMTWKNPFMRLR
ncbi:hypothetical protein NSK_000823 [Nannochloropsis salina CCMP1776]|uniref:Uncharacterized protein n=1 Tax=Nannochloropsis salina CCMP1776 TaxID=1027361 RepID=A0A4D9D7T1_9STRA|nr:hypothetical protein NSK_000823 [Nannochloropsis salina CCMP1776]|eukprot:TFJ87470.1 hypothetical protein NSK_000823 [Nannochloropsis salina CCMP1776]